MIIQELQPTDKNLLSTLKDDSIGRNSDLFYFIDILNEIDYNCAISIDGDWGSGKTFFVKQAQIIMQALNKYKLNETTDDSIISLIKGNRQDFETKYKNQLCVYYDAWLNDNDLDPIISIIYTISQEVKVTYDGENKNPILPKIASVVDYITGRNIKELYDNLKEKPESFFESIVSEQDVIKDVNSFFDAVLAERADRLVILIDELDRCKPSFAVKLLERVKHFFQNDRITFVYSTNIKQLQHTIKRYYGNEFDGGKYLDRFFNWRVDIPKLDMERYFNFLKIGYSNYHLDNIAQVVVKKYNFQMRELSKYISQIKISLYTFKNGSRHSYYAPYVDSGTFEFCLSFIVPILIGLKIYDSNLFNNFTHGKMKQDFIGIILAYKSYCGMFDSLLNNGETLRDSNNPNDVKVDIKDKLGEVYDALFADERNSNNSEINIGSYSFNKNLRDEIMRVSSMLSNQANYSK